MSDISLNPGTVIFVVDDDPLCQMMIRNMLDPDDVLLIEADSAAAAWHLLKDNSAVSVDLVLLDRSLPDGDGLDLLPRLRELPGMANVPVIIQSGLTGPEDVATGMQMGAFHYLEKPYRREMLRTLIRVAVRESRERKYLLEQMSRDSDGMIYMTGVEFQLRTMADVRSLAPCIAQMFPDPENAVVGISELMFNAVEHGNLEIDYAQKGELLKENAWTQEVERRLAMPEYRRRTVRVRVDRHDDRIELIIRDEGTGFDWKKYESLSEERMFDLHGRGILLARNMCFTGVEYRGVGNEVRCWVAL